MNKKIYKVTLTMGCYNREGQIVVCYYAATHMLDVIKELNADLLDQATEVNAIQEIGPLLKIL